MRRKQVGTIVRGIYESGGKYQVQEVQENGTVVRHTRSSLDEAAALRKELEKGHGKDPTKYTRAQWVDKISEMTWRMVENNNIKMIDRLKLLIHAYSKIRLDLSRGEERTVPKVSEMSTDELKESIRVMAGGKK